MRKAIILILLCKFFCLRAQNIQVSPSAVNKDEELSEFMNSLGFGSHAFKLNADTGLMLNILIEEYLNDSLIFKYDHLSTRSDYPEGMHDQIFLKTRAKTTNIRIYTHSLNDSIQKVMIRFGKIELVKKFRVNQKDFEYEFKSALEEKKNLSVKLNEKIPLLYLTTAVEETVNELVIQRFCQVPNILNNKRQLNNVTNILHYFLISVQCVAK